MALKFLIVLTAFCIEVTVVNSAIFISEISENAGITQFFLFNKHFVFLIKIFLIETHQYFSNTEFPGQCYDKETKRAWMPGHTIAMQNECGELRCRDDFRFSGAT